MLVGISIKQQINEISISGMAAVLFGGSDHGLVGLVTAYSQFIPTVGLTKQGLVYIFSYFVLVNVMGEFLKLAQRHVAKFTTFKSRYRMLL